MGPGAGEAPAVFGRFEAADPNELWCGDALHGPRVGDRKTYLLVTWNHAGGLLFVPRCHHELRSPVHCVGDLGREVAGLAASRAGVDFLNSPVSQVLLKGYIRVRTGTTRVRCPRFNPDWWA